MNEGSKQKSTEKRNRNGITAKLPTGQSNCYDMPM